MKLADAKLLLEYARLQLEVATSRNPAAVLDVTSATVMKTDGFKKLRAFFLNLRPAKREQFRRILRSEISAVREIVKLAKSTGEELSLADVTFIIRDEDGNEREAPVFGADDCPATGMGIDGVVDVDGQNYIKCPSCLQRWHANDIGFKIPQHPPVTA